MRTICNTIIAVAVLMAIFGCNGGKSAINKPTTDNTADILRKAGYTLLPFPDPGIRPGSIIQVTKQQGISVIGHLASCGVPDLAYATPLGSDALGLKGAGSISANAGVAAKWAGITFGPEVSAASSIRFVYESLGPDRIDSLKLQTWMKDNPKAFSEACYRVLTQPSAYLVQDAYVARKGSYEFQDKAGAKIQISAPKIEKVMDVSANVGASKSNDGTLEILKPVAIATKYSQWTGEFFKVLGDGKTRPDAITAEEIITTLPSPQIR